MKRRVLVAQALVHRPPVIVLDEPTAGVDVELRQSLWKFISRLNQDGHTIVLTTHYLEEAESLCGRIAMLKSGQVVALDTTANLLTRYGKTRGVDGQETDLEDVFMQIMAGDQQ
jgi:ABC-2 type transport system ATP-binding protein